MRQQRSDGQTEGDMKSYAIERDPNAGHDCYRVLYHGRLIGALDLHASGYCDWSFVAGGRLPSRSTQARLAAEARAIAHGVGRR